MSEKRIYTVGHSNRSADEFIETLHAHEIEVVCDIRSYPKSKKWPHFNSENLRAALEGAGIEYVWLGKKLGGWRRNVSGADAHTAIRSEGFRAYVAHLLSPEGESGLEELKELADKRATACMCAEKLPFRCHRWFLSDFLVLAGFEVVHIIGAKKTQTHTLPPLISLRDGKPAYDKPPQPELDGLESGLVKTD